MHLDALRHLSEFQFDRRCPPKDRDRDFQAVVRLVHILDHAIKTFEGAVGDLNLVADVKADQFPQVQPLVAPEWAKSFLH